MTSLQPAPTLPRKKVDAFGIKQNGQKLLIPLRDHKGKLWSFQEIDHKGNKLFLKNGKVKGLFHNIGEQTDVIYIGEGYATMASVHAATGKASVVAFNAGNLPKSGLLIQILRLSCLQTMTT